uniref:Uncharacterized protein n=1 Tax=Solanum lycopersicum TaxID=4081 RepID=K4DGK0_SOLLC
MDGGEAAPEGDDAGVSAVGGAGGDANGEDAVVGGFKMPEMLPVPVRKQIRQ